MSKDRDEVLDRCHADDLINAAWMDMQCGPEEGEMSTTTTEKPLTEIPKLLQACCDDEAILYDIGFPFVEGEFLWATDGRILARQPIEDFDPAFLKGIMHDRGRLPVAATAWNAYEDSGEWNDLPRDFRVTCDKCKGVERTECTKCYGERSSLVEEPLAVGSVLLGAHYVALLFDHGIRSVKVAGAKEPARFQQGRIEGIVMPIDPEKSKQP